MEDNSQETRLVAQYERPISSVGQTWADDDDLQGFPENKVLVDERETDRHKVNRRVMTQDALKFSKFKSEHMYI